jgi:hypothetical protein
MADNLTVTVAAGSAAVATDDIGSVHYQIVKEAFGALDSVTLVSPVNPLPVGKGQQTVTDCTITSGGSLSAAIDLGVYRLVGIAIPATFEPTSVTFQASYDGSTYNNVYDASGVEKAASVGVSRRVILSPSDFLGVRYVKVRGGTAGTPTTVAADRTLKLIAEA